MRNLLIALPAALILAAPAANSGTTELQLTEEQQSRLDQRLANRSAGDPVSCIGHLDQKHMSVISDGVIIFGRSRNSKTIYVNKPYLGCRGAERNTLVTQRPVTRLCSGEIATIQDVSIGA